MIASQHEQVRGYKVLRLELTRPTDTSVDQLELCRRNATIARGHGCQWALQLGRPREFVLGLAG